MKIYIHKSKADKAPFFPQKSGLSTSDHLEICVIILVTNQMKSNGTKKAPPISIRGAFFQDLSAISRQIDYHYNDRYLTFRQFH
jgi:hypothetical protein